MGFKPASGRLVFSTLPAYVVGLLYEMFQTRKRAIGLFDARCYRQAVEKDEVSNPQAGDWSFRPWPSSFWPFSFSMFQTRKRAIGLFDV